MICHTRRYLVGRLPQRRCPFLSFVPVRLASPDPSIHLRRILAGTGCPPFVGLRPVCPELAAQRSVPWTVCFMITVPIVAVSLRLSAIDRSSERTCRGAARRGCC